MSDYHAFTARCYRCNTTRNYDSFYGLHTAVSMGQYVMILGCEGIVCSECAVTLRVIQDEHMAVCKKIISQEIEDHRKSTSSNVLELKH